MKIENKWKPGTGEGDLRKWERADKFKSMCKVFQDGVKFALLKGHPYTGPVVIRIKRT